MNGYAYANNDPVTASDPSGLRPTCGDDNHGCALGEDGWVPNSNYWNTGGGGSVPKRRNPLGNGPFTDRFFHSNSCLINIKCPTRAGRLGDRWWAEPPPPPAPPPPPEYPFIGYVECLVTCVGLTINDDGLFFTAGGISTPGPGVMAGTTSAPPSAQSDWSQTNCVGFVVGECVMDGETGDGGRWSGSATIIGTGKVASVGPGVSIPILVDRHRTAHWLVRTSRATGDRPAPKRKNPFGNGPLTDGFPRPGTCGLTSYCSTKAGGLGDRWWA